MCSIRKKTFLVREWLCFAHRKLVLVAPVRGIGLLAHGCWAVDGRALTATNLCHMFRK